MKKMSKRLLAGALAGVMVTSFGGCSFKDNDAKSLNNESVSQTEDKVYTEASLKDCYMLVYTDVRGNKKARAVEVRGGDYLYDLLENRYLYASSKSSDEDLLDEYLEKFSEGGKYYPLITYLDTDYGIQEEYTAEEIDDSVEKTEKELEQNANLVLSKK